MTGQKRAIGRPIGSGMKNDDTDLRLVADSMVAEPGLKHTTAIKRLLATRVFAAEEMKQTVLRRWQGRWKKDGERYLQAARSKVLTAQPKTIPISMPSMQAIDLSAYAAIADQARSITNSSAF